MKKMMKIRMLSCGIQDTMKVIFMTAACLLSWLGCTNQSTVQGEWYGLRDKSLVSMMLDKDQSFNLKSEAFSSLMASAATFAQSKVYLTREISPESLVRIYKVLCIPAKGRVAVKMSTGEGSNPNYLKPELVKDLVYEVDGTIVECNTAYGNGPADKKDERNTSGVRGS